MWRALLVLLGRNRVIMCRNNHWIRMEFGVAVVNAWVGRIELVLPVDFLWENLWITEVREKSTVRLCVRMS